MNIRCFKEVIEQIQQIWNNVHESTFFSQNYKRSFNSTSNFVRIKTLEYIVQEINLWQNLENAHNKL
jgi:hypothetical protein